MINRNWCSLKCSKVFLAVLIFCFSFIININSSYAWTGVRYIYIFCDVSTFEATYVGTDDFQIDYVNMYGGTDWQSLAYTATLTSSNTYHIKKSLDMSYILFRVTTNNNVTDFRLNGLYKAGTTIEPSLPIYSPTPSPTATPTPTPTPTVGNLVLNGTDRSSGTTMPDDTITFNFNNDIDTAIVTSNYYSSHTIIDNSVLVTLSGNVVNDNVTIDMDVTDFYNQSLSISQKFITRGEVNFVTWDFSFVTDFFEDLATGLVTNSQTVIVAVFALMGLIVGAFFLIGLGKKGVKKAKG